MRTGMMREMGWQVDKEVNRDKTDEVTEWICVGTKWLVRETRKVEDYLQDDFIYSTIYKIFKRRTHSRYIKVDKVLQRVLSRRSQRNVLLDTSFHVDSRETFCLIVQPIS